MDHTYTCLPVKTVKLYKDGKERPIALFSMRDKVVQQSAAEELTKLFDPLFSRGTIAYRPGKSALNAVDLIERQIVQNHYSHALKLDIVRYFEHIQWNLLKQKLMIKVTGSDEIELIRRLTMAQSLDHEGNLCEKNIGLYQGSSLSPVLSNVYLMDFDSWLHSRSDFFIRYSDDILVLGNSEESLKDLLAEIQVQMEGLGLILSEEKSELVSLDKGITFLGYSFNSHGKAITEKAQRQLSEKLEMVWIMNRSKPCTERLAKLAEILGGWQQYFRGERTVSDILEYAALVFMTRNKEELDSVMARRPAFRNIYKDLMTYFQTIWMQKDRQDLILLEYEQFTGISDGNSIAGALSSDQIQKLNTLYDQALSDMSEESYTELMQLYSDFHQFQKADMAADIIDRIHCRRKTESADQAALLSKETHSMDTDSPDSHQSYSTWSPDLIDKYLQLFSGREDTYALLEITAGRKSQVMQPEPLSQDVVRKHLAGECIAATYVQRPNGTARFMVIDIDISRKILLQYGSEDAVISRYLKKAADAGQKINTFLNHKGLEARYEFSGFRGYHLWIFFDSWVQVRYLNMLQDMIEENFTDLRTEGEITLEFFPNKTKVRPGQAGQTIKLPLCIVDSSNKRSRLLNDDFSVCDQEEEWIDSAPLHPVSLLKRALAVSGPAHKACLTGCPRNRKCQ
jgi:group II intron reverse transcriptase/maturase